MAHDLIFGKTVRDWSCGGSPAPTDPATITTQAQVDDLARDTNSEIIKSTNLAIKLSRSKRMPDAEKEPFKRFHRKWLAFMDARRGRYRLGDSLALWNFRKINERFKSRFDVFAKVAITPLRKPPEPSDAEAAALSPKTSSWGWAVSLFAGLALAGLTLLGGSSKRPTTLSNRSIT